MNEEIAPVPTQSTPPAIGGFGGFLRPQNTRDTRMVYRALKGRWGGLNGEYDQLQPVFAAIALNESRPFRERATAAKIVLECERQNQADGLHAAGSKVQFAGAVAHLDTVTPSEISAQALRLLGFPVPDELPDGTPTHTQEAHQQ